MRGPSSVWRIVTATSLLVGGCLKIQCGVDCRSGAMVNAEPAPASEVEGFSLVNRRFLDK